MWALLLAALAHARTPPNIRLDDIEKWEDAAEQLLDMPPGCWEWVGQASWDWHTGKYGKTRGDAVFAGKTTDGRWGEVALQPLGEIQQRDKLEREQRVYADKARFVPMVGRLPGGRVVVAGQDAGDDSIEDAEALNVLRQVINRVGGEAFTSWAEWDEARGGVVLNRVIPLASNRKEEVKVQIFFPNGGDEPSLLDVRFPKKFKAALRGNDDDDTQLGKIRMGLFAFTIKNAEVHIRGLIRGKVVYPSSEAFRFRFGFMGFKYHGAQTVVYKKVKRCAVQPVPAEGVTAPPAADAMVAGGTTGGTGEGAGTTEPAATDDAATPQPAPPAPSGEATGDPAPAPAPDGAPDGAPPAEAPDDAAPAEEPAPTGTPATPEPAPAPSPTPTGPGPAPGPSVEPTLLPPPAPPAPSVRAGPGGVPTPQGAAGDGSP